MQFAFSEYQLDTQTRTLQRRGERIHVEAKVFDLLVYLIEHRERIVSADELLDALWSGVSVTPVALSRAVGKARRAVGDDGDRQAVLSTEHGRGFRFVAEVSIVPAADAVTATSSGYAWTRRNLRAALVPVGLVAAAVGLWVGSRATAPLPGEPSIAVLPFVNFSGDPEQEYFSDGITEELIHKLTAIEELHVIGRTSSFFFKGKDVDLRTIGETLGVDHLLEGSVRRSGTRLRVTAQLVTAADGLHLWSNSYDRELDDIFKIQEEIAGNVAEALQIELGLNAANPVAGQTTENRDAYLWNLRGGEIFDRLNESNLEHARAAFERASEFDPEYLPPYINIATIRRIQFAWGLGSAANTLVPAERRVRQALAINPNYSDAHAELGALLVYSGDWNRAEEEFKRALELDPNNFRTLYMYGYALSQFQGRPHEAVPMLERVTRMDPLHFELTNSYALALAKAGRVDDAVRELERIAEIDPTYSFSYYSLGVFDAWYRAQYASGIRWLLRSFELNPRAAEVAFELAILFLDLGDAASAERWVEVAERNSAGSNHGDLGRFALELYRGDNASAELTSRRLAETVETREGYQHISYYTWLRELQRTNPDLAKRVYARLHPELLQENPRVDAWNHAVAISLAVWKRRSGDNAAADLLLRRSLSVIQETTDPYYPPASAMAYLLLGETDSALGALHEAIDANWRFGSWFLEHDPTYAPLWDHPKFQTLMTELRADMAGQLAELREMEKRGELAAIPRDEANLH
jgi:TolB-like protein/DNA-binding winged helix-turn-helix (wHTH) protein/Tfp pilus assembly protein PilF